MTIAYKVPNTDEIIVNEITDKVENEAIAHPIDDDKVMIDEDQITVK